MRRITNFPTDVAFGRDGTVFVLLRTEGAALIRVWSIDDAEQLTGDLVQIGGYGTGDGQFQWPVQLVCNEDGDLFVSDEATHRITRFKEDGEFVSKWGTEGSGPGEWKGPAGIAFDPEGNLVVVDSQNHRVQRFTANGEYLGAFGSYGSDPGQFDLPMGVHVDELGDIYVADWGNERVQILGPDGSFQVLLQGEATVSKWADDYFASNPEEKVERDNANLMPALPDHLSSPYHVSSQTESYFWGPVSVSLDGAGRLYVTETNRHRFQVYQKQ